MKKDKILFLLLLFLASTSIHSQEIKIDLLTDGILLGTGLTFTIISELIVNSQQVSDSNIRPNINDLNFIDKLVIFDYSETLDLVSDILQYTAFLTPCMLIYNTSFSDWIDISVIYVEALTFAFGTKNLLKYLIPRYRPFLYFDNISDELWNDPDSVNSFPSGHTTIAFTSATYATYMFNYYYKNSKWMLPVAIFNYSIAFTTAYLRIASGSHFISDVTAGAVIGIISGFIFPHIHLNNKDNKANNVVMNLHGNRFELKISL